MLYVMCEFQWSVGVPVLCPLGKQYNRLYALYVVVRVATYLLTVAVSIYQEEPPAVTDFSNN
jgi:hypothetical protein